MREPKKLKKSRIEMGTRVERRRKGNAKRPIGQAKRFWCEWNGEKG
jgi:hypothetical protein